MEFQQTGKSASSGMYGSSSYPPIFDDEPPPMDDFEDDDDYDNDGFLDFQSTNAQSSFWGSSGPDQGLKNTTSEDNNENSFANFGTFDSQNCNDKLKDETRIGQNQFAPSSNGFSNPDEDFGDFAAFDDDKLELEKTSNENSERMCNHGDEGISDSNTKQFANKNINKLENNVNINSCENENEISTFHSAEIHQSIDNKQFSVDDDFGEFGMVTMAVGSDIDDCMMNREDVTPPDDLVNSSCNSNDNNGWNNGIRGNNLNDKSACTSQFGEPDFESFSATYPSVVTKEEQHDPNKPGNPDENSNRSFNASDFKVDDFMRLSAVDKSSKSIDVESEMADGEIPVTGSQHDGQGCSNGSLGREEGSQSTSAFSISNDSKAAMPFVQKSDLNYGTEKGNYDPEILNDKLSTHRSINEVGNQLENINHIQPEITKKENFYLPKSHSIQTDDNQHIGIIENDAEKTKTESEVLFNEVDNEFGNFEDFTGFSNGQVQFQQKNDDGENIGFNDSFAAFKGDTSNDFPNDISNLSRESKSNNAAKSNHDLPSSRITKISSTNSDEVIIKPQPMQTTLSDDADDEFADFSGFQSTQEQNSQDFIFPKTDSSLNKVKSNDKVTNTENAGNKNETDGNDFGAFEDFGNAKDNASFFPAEANVGDNEYDGGSGLNSPQNDITTTKLSTENTDSDFDDFASFSNRDSSRADGDWASFGAAQPTSQSSTAFDAKKVDNIDSFQLATKSQASPNLQSKDAITKLSARMHPLLSPCFPRTTTATIMPPTASDSGASFIESFLSQDKHNGLPCTWSKLNDSEEGGEVWNLSFSSSTNFKWLLTTMGVSYEHIVKKWKHSSHDTPATLSPASSVASFDVDSPAEPIAILVPEPAGKFNSLLKPTLLAQSQQKEIDIQRVPSASSLRKGDSGSETASETASLDLDFFSSSAPPSFASSQSNKDLAALTDVDFFSSATANAVSSFDVMSKRVTESQSPSQQQPEQPAAHLPFNLDILSKAPTKNEMSDVAKGYVILLIVLAALLLILLSAAILLRMLRRNDQPRYDETTAYSKLPLDETDMIKAKKNTHMSRFRERNKSNKSSLSWNDETSSANPGVLHNVTFVKEDNAEICASDFDSASERGSQLALKRGSDFNTSLNRKDPAMVSQHTKTLRIQISVIYNEEKKYIAGKITKLENVPRKDGGPNQIKVHLAYLPAKRYILRTRYLNLDASASLIVDEYFKLKFKDIPDLDKTALRYRLYGRRSNFGIPAKETCLGEAFVYLTDFAQAKGGVTLWRDILPKGSTGTSCD
eukprot:gene20386-22396_t